MRGAPFLNERGPPGRIIRGAAFRKHPDARVPVCVCYLTEPLPVRGEADDDTVMLSDSREEGDELVLLRRAFIEDEWARDGEV